MNSNNRTYQAADFARYYAGTMPATEMHALEKAALEDPFLADALDGYAQTMNGVNETAEIKKQLFQQHQKLAVVAKYDFRFLLRIAAILIFIGVAGYFYYLVNRNPRPVSLAQKEKQTTSETVQPQKLLTETATINDTATLPEENIVVPQKSENQLLADNLPPRAISKPKSTQADKVTQQPNRASKKQNEPIGSEDQKTYFTQSGSVQDLKGAPLAAATVKDKNSNYGTLTDDNGRFNLKTFDSNATVIVSSVGFSQKEIVLSNSAPQKITLQDDQKSLSEVVVMGYGSTRKKASQGAASSTVSTQLQGKVAGVNVQSGIANKSKVAKQLPIADSTILNPILSGYISRNKIPLFDDNNEPSKGIVTVSYNVDKVGKVKNIEILSSSCANCSSEIIRLLTNAPLLRYQTLSSQQVTLNY